MSVEFRVRWRRDGKTVSTCILQKWESAWRKAQTIQALEQIKGDSASFSSMPDLVEGPTIQSREVGEWSVHDVQPPAEIPEHAITRVRAWACVPAEPEYGSGPF